LITTSYNAQISLASVTPGYYKLHYAHGFFKEDGSFPDDVLNASWETDTIVVHMFPNSKCAGGDIESSQTAVGTLDLNTLLPSASCPTVASGGAWTDDDSVGAAFNVGTGVLDLSQLSTGTYNFTYSLLPSGFTQLQPGTDCVDMTCLNQAATVTIILNSGLVASIVNETETATVTQVFRNPDTEAMNNVKMYLQNNNSAVTLHGQTYISDDKGINAFVEDNIFRSLYHYTGHVGTLQNEGYILYLDFVDAADSPVRINVAPNNNLGYLGTLTGPFGTVTPSDLAFDQFNIYDWLDSMEIVIKNGLDAAGYAANEYNLARKRVLQSTSTTWQFEFDWRSKHNPSGEWLGVEVVQTTVGGLDLSGTDTLSTNLEMQHGLDLDDIEFESYNSTALGCVAAGDLLTHYRVTVASWATVLD
jgi:hypothetical protein